MIEQTRTTPAKADDAPDIRAAMHAAVATIEPADGLDRILARAQTGLVIGNYGVVPFEGVPSAGDTYLRNGIPTVEIHLGAGLDVRATDLLWLDEAESAIRTARARLSMWGTDHQDKDA